MSKILHEGPATIEGRAGNAFVVVEFPQSNSGMIISRGDFISLWGAMNRKVQSGFDEFTDPELIAFPIISEDDPRHH